MAQAHVRLPHPPAAIGSFVCLALLAPWLLFCLIQGGGGLDGTGLALLAWLIHFSTGALALSALGVAFGVAARQSGWGLLALALNALAVLFAGAPLFMLLGGWR